MDETYVTVYSYLRPATRAGDEPEMAPDKAIAEVIRSMPGATLLEGTAMQVPADELDPRSHWRRVATGWGDLSEV